MLLIPPSVTLVIISGNEQPKDIEGIQYPPTGTVAVAVMVGLPAIPTVTWFEGALLQDPSNKVAVKLVELLIGLVVTVGVVAFPATEGLQI